MIEAFIEMTHLYNSYVRKLETLDGMIKDLEEDDNHDKIQSCRYRTKRSCYRALAKELYNIITESRKKYETLLCFYEEQSGDRYFNSINLKTKKQSGEISFDEIEDGGAMDDLLTKIKKVYLTP